jgi:hypothetical protein
MRQQAQGSGPAREGCALAVSSKEYACRVNASAGLCKILVDDDSVLADQVDLVVPGIVHGFASPVQAMPFNYKIRPPVTR